jgi:hypothetical protein
VVTPDHSWGFLTPLAAAIFAIGAVLIGLALGAVAARIGRSLIGWLLAVYVILFLVQVVVGFRALEALYVMSIALVIGPFTYGAERRRRRTASRRPRRGRATTQDG